MKKILILSALLCGLTGVSAHAANGDVVGHIYSTDIRAYINDIEVPSYNIGGRTVVIIEDITVARDYQDNLRALTIDGISFRPEYITEGEAEHSEVSGNIVGDIYETDIKTYMYDVEIPSYNLDGKTAVALEDLGEFKGYNDFGGRYFYDDETRTIKLEVIYETPLYDILVPANIKFSLSDDKTQVNAEFYSDPYSYGGKDNYSDDFPDFQENVMLPIMTKINGEEKQLGWHLEHNSKFIDNIGIEMNGEILTSGYVVNYETDDYKDVYELKEQRICINYIFKDVLREGKSMAVMPELSKREQTLRDIILYSIFYEEDRLETEDYLFVYATTGSSHGASSHLILIQNDGSYHDYNDDFESVSLYGQKMFDDVTIDKANEKCYFHYDVDYVIDLKTGELKTL